MKLTQLITKKDIKSGKEYLLRTPDSSDDLREAEISYSELLDKYCIWFNGKLFSYTTFTSFHLKVNKLMVDWELKPVYK